MTVTTVTGLRYCVKVNCEVVTLRQAFGEKKKKNQKKKCEDERVVKMIRCSNTSHCAARDDDATPRKQDAEFERHPMLITMLNAGAQQEELLAGLPVAVATAVHRQTLLRERYGRK